MGGENEITIYDEDGNIVIQYYEDCEEDEEGEEDDD